MQPRLEDYALIGDCRTAALVSRAGSIDWLCLPRFDSGACFAALLGEKEHGRWLITPVGEIQATRRRYRPGTLVLETELATASGAVQIVDFMPLRNELVDLCRIVIGLRGAVPMRTELILRFDYGNVVPWVRRTAHGISAIAGPDLVQIRSAVPLRGESFATVGEFTVKEGQRVCFDMAWRPSHRPSDGPLDPHEALRATETWWTEWNSRNRYRGEYQNAVRRSLVVLKGLTYEPTGGIVAAPTTSLPAQLGGVRNWDYRFCWLRDATFTLYALRNAGYLEEARAWREWLLRAAAGKPSQMHIMYGIAGERRLVEHELHWLPGYHHSRPVRVGNEAYHQLQLDVFGEVMDVLHSSHRAGLARGSEGWRLERSILHFLEGAWDQPDEGIWEVRGPRRQFTHSKMMAWVAIDRAVKDIEDGHLTGEEVTKWRGLRDTIHQQVCREGFNPSRNAFTQFYGSKSLDASLLMMPLVGFLPPGDERVRGTVAAIERDLTEGCFVHRYDSQDDVDGLPPGEASFLLCSFWLVDNLILQGRMKEARARFERLLDVRSDLGLLAEGYDVPGRRQLGNYPQAFSHIGLVNTAFNLQQRGPAEERR